MKALVNNSSNSFIRTAGAATTNSSLLSQLNLVISLILVIVLAYRLPLPTKQRNIRNHLTIFSELMKFFDSGLVFDINRIKSTKSALSAGWHEWNSTRRGLLTHLLSLSPKPGNYQVRYYLRREQR